MAGFPSEIISFIKRFPIEKYFKDRGLEFKESSTGANEQFILNKCPHCGSINHKGNFKAFKVYVGKEKRNFMCYVCNEQGSLLKLLAFIEDMSVKGILNKYLSDEYVESIPDDLPDLLTDAQVKVEEPFIEIDLPAEFEPIFNRPQGKFKKAYQYCQNRGILDKRIGHDLDIRYCENYKFRTPSGETHYLNKRLIFPVYFEGKCVGFQGRDITGLSPLSYYISEGLPKRRIFVNYDNVKNAETITLCEGIIDMIKCWNYHPVALFGKSLTNEQLTLMFQMPNLKRVILAVDPDTKIPDRYGNIAYNKLRDKVKNHFEVLEIELLPGKKDCGDHTIQEMDTILANAKPYQESELPKLGL